MAIPRDLLEQIVTTLRGRRLPDGSWMVHCPAHHDEHPSLHITPAEDKLLFHCFAGCSFDDIKDALERLGLYQPGRIAIAKAYYVYHDEFGNVLYRKVRFEPKTFRWERPQGQMWVPGLGDVRRVLYRLPEVLKAQEVWIVEGEKDVETLRRFGLVATTNPHGAAEAITEEYVEPLRGKNIIIVPDQDEPGRRHAGNWVEALRLVAKSIRVVEIPAKDVSDFLINHSIDELIELAKNTPTVAEQGTPKFEIVARYGGARVNLPKSNITFELFPIRIDAVRFVAEASLITQDGTIIWTTRKDFADDITRMKIASNLEQRFPLGIWHTLLESVYLHLRSKLTAATLSQDKPERSWLCRPFISKQGLNVIYGPMGHFKSLILEAVALSIASGRALLPGIELYETGKVIWLDFEGLGTHVVFDRAQRILGREPENFLAFTIHSPLDTSYAEIIRLLEREQPILLIIDSLGPAVGGDLSTPSAAFGFFSSVWNLNIPIAVVAHPPKRQPDSIYGSSFFGNLARNIWLVEKLTQLESSSFVTLFHEKFSFGPPVEPISLEIKFDDIDRKIYFRPWRPIMPTKAFTSGPLGMRVLNYLRASGEPMPPNQIAKACEIPPAMINVVLKQLEGLGLISRNGKNVLLAPALRGKIEPGDEDMVPF